MTAIGTEIKTKVLIVGGGPAGATAARYLAEGGVDTVLVERDLSYVKPCAGGIPSTAFHEFALPKNLIEKQISKFTVVSPRDRTVEIQLEGEVFISNRAFLDPTLRSMAADKGALLLEAQFIGFERINSAKISFVRRKKTDEVIKVQSDYVFAADGISCSVGRCIDSVKQHYVCTISTKVHSFIGDTCEFWLGSDHASHFYSWFFPTSSGASIGTGSQKPRELRHMLDVFMQRRFGNSMKYLQDKNLCEQPRVFLIPVWSGNKFREGNIFFLGDAAGMVSPVTGEGIYYAMKSGCFAAQAVISKKPDMYQQLWEQKFLDKFTKMKKLQDEILISDEAVEAWIALQCGNNNARSV